MERSSSQFAQNNCEGSKRGLPSISLDVEHAYSQLDGRGSEPSKDTRAIVVGISEYINLLNEGR